MSGVRSQVEQPHFRFAVRGLCEPACDNNIIRIYITRGGALTCQTLSVREAVTVAATTTKSQRLATAGSGSISTRKQNARVGDGFNRAQCGGRV